jgi:hypothetical protein
MWIAGQYSNYWNILICTSTETSTVIRKCGFCVKTVTSESRSACLILTCYKTQSRTPWKLCRKVKVKQSRNMPGVAQRVPGGLGSHIFMIFDTWRWRGCQPHVPAAFTPRKCSWYSFSLGAESIPGPWYGRKEYNTENSSDTTRNRSLNRPTSSAAP